jgi:hypothetical protein
MTLMPPHRHVILPASDLVTELKRKLATHLLTAAGFEEIIRQCFDVYMEWNGDDDQVMSLPYFNRIEIPTMSGAQYQVVYETVQHSIHVFARALFQRLVTHGFFPKSHRLPNLDFAFKQFVDNDVMLQYVSSDVRY